MNRRKFIKSFSIFVPTWFVCSGGAVSLSNLEPEVGIWMQNTKSVSGNYTSKSIVCNDFMMKTLKSNNLRSRIIRMNTFTGIGINAIKSCLIMDANPGVNDEINPFGTPFVDADFSESTGLVGNGTKALLSGCKQSDLYALDGTNHSFSYGVYVCASNNQSGFSMGMFDGGDFTYLYVSNAAGTTFFSGGQTANQITASDSAGTGFYCGSRYSSSSMKIFKRGVEIATTGSAGSASSGNIYWVGIFDVNNQNVAGVAASTKTFGGYFCGNSISSADQVVLDYIWTRGMGILGRSVT